MTGKLGTVETHPGLTLYLGRLGWNRKMITMNRSKRDAKISTYCDMFEERLRL